MTPDQMNPDICPSALEEDGTLDRSKWDGAHKFYENEQTGLLECAECGATRSGHLCGFKNCERPATVNYQDAFIRWTLDDEGAPVGRGLDEMEIITAGDEINQFFCDEHDTPENRG